MKTLTNFKDLQAKLPILDLYLSEVRDFSLSFESNPKFRI